MPLLTLDNTKWVLEAQVQPGQDVFDLRPEEITQDLVNAFLKLRERNLRNKNLELRFLLADARETDARLYQQSITETIKALSRLQRILVARPASEPQSLAAR